MTDDERVFLPGKVHVHAAKAGNVNVAAAYRSCFHFQVRTMLPFKGQLYSVGVGPAKMHCGENQGKSLLLCQRQGIPQTGIVHRHAQQSPNNGAVGAVTMPGFGKGAMKADVCLHRALPKQQPGDQADACGACGMRAAGTDHDRTDNVEQIHILSFLFIGRGQLQLLPKKLSHCL